jgi:hypothetical protein
MTEQARIRKEHRKQLMKIGIATGQFEGRRDVLRKLVDKAVREAVRAPEKDVTQTASPVVA